MSNLITWYLVVLKKYVCFTGRARRAEFWWFMLTNMIISVLINTLSITLVSVTGIEAMVYLSTLYNLFIMLPSLGVSIRRLHDIGYKGWWLLVPFYNIYLFALDSDPDTNAYGEKVK